MSIREEVVVGVQVQGVESLTNFKKTADEARGSVRGLKDVFSTADAHSNFLSKEELAKSQVHLTRIKETYTDLSRIAIENGRAIAQMTEKLAAMKGLERDTPEGVERSDLADALRAARRHQRSMGGRMRGMRGFITEAEERVSGFKEGGAGGSDEAGGAGGLLSGVGSGLLRRLAPAALAYWAYGKLGQWGDTAERFMGSGAQLGAQMFPRGMPGGGFRGVRDMFYSSHMGFTPTEQMEMALGLSSSGAYVGEPGRARLAGLTHTTAEAARAMGLTSQQAAGIVGTVAGATQSDPNAVQRILERIHETLKAGDFGTLKPQTVEQLARAIAAARQHAGGGELSSEGIQNMVKFVERFAVGGSVIGREQGVNTMMQISGTLDSAPKGSPLWFAKLRAMGYRGGGLHEMNEALDRWEEADPDTRIRAFTGVLKEGGYSQDQIKALLRDNFGLTGKRQRDFWAAEARRGGEGVNPVTGKILTDVGAGYGSDISALVDLNRGLKEMGEATAGEDVSKYRNVLKKGVLGLLGLTGDLVGAQLGPVGAGLMGRTTYEGIVQRQEELKKERSNLSEQVSMAQDLGGSNRDEIRQWMAQMERIEKTLTALDQMLARGVSVEFKGDAAEILQQAHDVEASIRSQRGGDNTPNKGGTKK